MLGKISLEYFHFLNFINVGNGAIGVIAGSVALGVFIASAIVLAWWRLRKSREHFFDVPGG